MQAQSRICPVCCDDHLEHTKCKHDDLVERINLLVKLVESLTTKLADFEDDMRSNL